MQKNPARFPPGLLSAKFCKITLYDTIDVTESIGKHHTAAAHKHGEAHGRCVISHSARKLATPDWLRKNVIALPRPIAEPAV
jgi:hypothetical protein